MMSFVGAASGPRSHCARGRELRVVFLGMYNTCFGPSRHGVCKRAFAFFLLSV